MIRKFTVILLLSLFIFPSVVFSQKNEITAPDIKITETEMTSEEEVETTPADDNERKSEATDADAPETVSVDGNQTDSETTDVDSLSSHEPVSSDNTSASSAVTISFDSEGNHIEYALVVEKESQQLFLYANDKTDKELFCFDCSTGKNRGIKLRSGDMKTPEGVYFFIKIHEKKELAPIYGIRAFPTDYPNLLDRIAERSGDGIWLHGTNKPLKDRDSNGCVALQDADVEQLTQYISLNRTPLIIAKKVSYEPFTTDRKSAILELLSKWNAALTSGTYHEYVAFYDADYVPDITWWQTWNKFRKSFEASDDIVSVTSEKILMVRYGDICTILFDQMVHLSDQKILAGIKKFFLKEEGNRIRIIGEEYQAVPEAFGDEMPFMVAARNLKNRLMMASANTSSPESYGADKSEIEQLIDGWLNAWSSKDIDAYGDYYAADFRSRGMNKKAWLDYKAQLNQKYDYIRVSKNGDLSVKKEKERCTVFFTQHYESSGFSGITLKQLILIRENGEWKIYREISGRS